MWVQDAVPLVLRCCKCSSRRWLPQAPQHIQLGGPVPDWHALQAHERHAVEAVAQQQAADVAEHQQRLLAQQQRLGVDRLRGIAEQVMACQQEALQLQQRVAELEQLQKEAAATVLTAAATAALGAKRRGGGAPAVGPSPAAAPAGPDRASPAKRLPRSSSASPAATPSGPALPLAAAPAACAPSQQPEAVPPADEPHEQLALAAPRLPPASEWSELSSLPCSPRSTAPPAPRTVSEAADFFYRACLLRHALWALQREAERGREQVARAEQHWARRVLAKCLAAWQEGTQQTQLWLAEVQPALRRRGCLRRWAAWVRERKRLRACEERLQAAYRRWG